MQAVEGILGGLLAESIAKDETNGLFSAPRPQAKCVPDCVSAEWL